VSDRRSGRTTRGKTDDCDQPIVVPGDTHLVRGTDDPVEAVERIVSRRKLMIERGDVFISRAPDAIRGSAERDIYQLVRHDLGPVPGRFTSFENAVVAGDEFATKHQVRLYFQESPDHPPQLLKDCRRS
jgi:hypothetical protein